MSYRFSPPCAVDLRLATDHRRGPALRTERKNDDRGDRNKSYPDDQSKSNDDHSKSVEITVNGVMPPPAGNPSNNDGNERSTCPVVVPVSLRCSRQERQEGGAEIAFSIQ